MLEKRWVLNQVDEATVSQLAQSLKIHPVLCRLLVQRGITTFDQAHHFFRPSLSDLHDPFLMKDMDKALERIEEAMQREEKILIYGDYDVDGTTAVALMHGFLKDFYDKIDYYIPDRYREGYGISDKGVDHAISQGFSLVIALDCGIKAVEQVERAKAGGVDFIICDHHLPGVQLPQAVAVLDPKRTDCEYPYKELCGCGIGFKLIQAFAERNNIPSEVVEKQLDLVAISTAADIVPITGENRVLAYYGLKLLNSKPRPGIRSMMELSGVEKELTITELVFIIGPRINAAGRLDDARKAVELLIAEGATDADPGAKKLQDKNTERKRIDSEITQEALAMIEGRPEFKRRKSTVLFQPHWNKGVIGIVASRLIETHYKPTVVLTESEGMVTGSARSVQGFDLYEAIQSCEDLLERYGGHKYAAGLTMRKENLERFVQRFEEAVAATIPDDLLIPEVKIDAELKLQDITEGLYNIIRQFAPFGPGNMRPVFLSKGVMDKGGSRVVGDTHLKLHVHQGNGIETKGIAFGMGEMADAILKKNGRTALFDLCYNIEENEWKGYRNLELNVKDIKVGSSDVVTKQYATEGRTLS